ncbi:hypothetical protein LCGC14_1765820 [marine sediment metagenome]|uniref:Uncharacterized protein n=1 Tax=marine sediment metagenome TaxID=412755 RepID=A0A0F9JEP3_9ZZZZ
MMSWEDFLAILLILTTGQALYATLESRGLGAKLEKSGDDFKELVAQERATPEAERKGFAWMGFTFTVTDPVITDVGAAEEEEK